MNWIQIKWSGTKVSQRPAGAEWQDNLLNLIYGEKANDNKDNFEALLRF